MAPRSFLCRGNLEHLMIMNMVEFAIVLPAFHLPPYQPDSRELLRIFQLPGGPVFFSSAALFDLYRYYATCLNGLLF